MKLRTLLPSLAVLVSVSLPVMADMAIPPRLQPAASPPRPALPVRPAPSAAKAAPSASAAPSAAASSARPATEAPPPAPKDLPPGHPPIAGNHAGGPNTKGRFRDVATEDPALPRGTIRVELRGVLEQPLPGLEVKLARISQSVSKGESRNYAFQKTDASGATEFSGQETTSEMAYRISVHQDGAQFAVTPFRLSPSAGMRVLLHVLPVVKERPKDLDITAFAHLEMREDRMQIVQMFQFLNRSDSAWVPENVSFELPAEHKGFVSPQQMSDQTLTLDGNRVTVKGTFGPGQHSLEMRWQVLWSGQSELSAMLPVFERTQRMRVISMASENMTLSVDGFDRSERQKDDEGQEFLVAERARPLTTNTIRATIAGLPSPGPARWYVTAAVFAMVAFGLYGVTKRRTAPETEKPEVVQARLLDDFVLLEEARRRGDIGPSTYETTKRELLEQLARCLLAMREAR